MYSMGVLVVVDGHKPGMYSLGVLVVVVVDGHKSGPGRKACVLTVLAARDGLQHIWVHACLPCLQRCPPRSFGLRLAVSKLNAAERRTQLNADS